MEERITRLEERLDQIEGKLDRVTGLLERMLDKTPSQPPEVQASMARIAALAPELEYVAHGLSAAPELLSEAADLLRGLSGAVDVDARIRGSMAALEALTAPETLQALVLLGEASGSVTPERVASGARLLAHAGQLEPLLAGLAAQPRALALLVELGAALDAAPAVSQPIGPLGLLTVLRDPEVQRTLGAALSVTRHLGRAMADEPK